MADGTQDNKEGGAGAGEQKPADGADAGKHWSDTYPEDIRSDLRGYDKPETLAKEHVSLKKKFVVPEKPEEYEFDEKELDDVMKQNLNAFRTKAKEFGLTKDQFKNLTAYELQLSKQLRERITKVQKDAEEAEEKKIKEGIDELKKDWGNKFESNIKLSKKVMNNIFPASFGKFLDDTGLGNNPEMVRAMVRLAETISEDVLVKNTGKNKANNRDPQTGEPMLKFTSMQK